MGAASAWARPAVEAVLNGVWQGILLVAVLALGMRLARRANAATRYAVWFITLAAVAVLPPVGWAWRALVGSFGAGGTAEADAALTLPGGPWPEVALAVWLGTSIILLLRVARGYRSMQALKERSEPLSAEETALFGDLLEEHRSRRPIRVRRSRELPSPITAGLANPMILLPVDLLRALDGEDLRRIVLHELTHVRRGDDRAILLQRFIEAVFFFHPAVRFVASRLDLEREVACDDRVVELTGERKAYARCLARLAELGVVRHSALASGALLHRGHLVRRVTLLLDPRRRVGERVSTLLAGGALAAVAAAVLWLGARAPLVGVPADGGEQVATDEAGAPRPTPLTPAEALDAAPLVARLPVWEPVRLEEGWSAAARDRMGEPSPPPRREQPRPTLAADEDGPVTERAARTAPAAPERRAERAVAEEEEELIELEAFPGLEGPDALPGGSTLPQQRPAASLRGDAAGGAPGGDAARGPLQGEPLGDPLPGERLGEPLQGERVREPRDIAPGRPAGEPGSRPSASGLLPAATPESPAADDGQGPRPGGAPRPIEAASRQRP